MAGETSRIQFAITYFDMKSTLLALLFVFVAVSSGYQVDNDDYDPFEPFITGGTNTVLGQFPAVVAIVTSSINNNFCGGVILNQNHVLTSAHCMLTPSDLLLFPSSVGVVAGQLEVLSTIPVNAIYVHPGYNPFTYENNIAVVRTAEVLTPPEVATPNIAFAQLGFDIPYDGEQCQVVGWNNAATSPVQQFINVTIENRDACNEHEVHRLRIEESMVCASGSASQGVCARDIGTPLFCNGRVVGILAHGFGCGTSNVPGVYAQVRFYRDWIEEQFMRQDVPQGGTSPIW